MVKEANGDKEDMGDTGDAGDTGVSCLNFVGAYCYTPLLSGVAKLWESAVIGHLQLVCMA